MLPAQLDDTYALVRSRVNRTAYRLTRESGPPPPLEVEILSGVHARCTTELTLPDFTIGGGEDHDLMLIDDCIAGEPVRVAARRTLLGPVLIVSTARTDVAVDGQSLAGSDGIERLPCRLTVGEVTMVIRERPAATGGVRSGRAEWLVAAALAVAGLAALAAPWALQGGGASGQVLTLAETAASPLPANGAPAVLAGIEGRISASGLADHLTTAERPDGTLVVSGRLPPSKMALWRELQRELDGQVEPGRLLMQVSQASDLADVPAIRLVRLGAEPQLLLADRRTVSVGDELVDGWRVAEIAADGLTVSRGGETVRMTY